MKMRQYIAITDHILWDIITNGNQTTTDPASPSVSAPKTSLAANARRNNEKALNILLSAIPDRHLLSFHDAVDARSLWTAIKARFGGNEASKKMQKNLLKQQFETFTIGSREELDSAYERFQNILSMLELYDAKVSLEDANLKFLRSLPSVWHVVYEHELKGVSNSSSQNIAFLSTEVKGSTLKQSTADPANIPKGYTQAASSKVQTAPNCASHSDWGIGLPSKTFKLDHSCLACRKGKQHRASCKKIEVRTVREPLELLHMDLFGPVSVESINTSEVLFWVVIDKFELESFLERKSDETEQVIIEEEKDTSDVKSGDTEELDLERIQSTARQSAVTPRTLNFDDEAGPS
ncbi:hypothetical protein Tco_1196881, partial [Tanacetum coccineum]